MISQCLSKTTCVVSQIRRIDHIKCWQNQQTLSLDKLEDIIKFKQKEEDENYGLFDCLLKCRGDMVPFAGLLVIDEGVNSSVTKSFVEIVGSTIRNESFYDSYFTIVLLESP